MCAVAHVSQTTSGERQRRAQLCESLRTSLGMLGALLDAARDSTTLAVSNSLTSHCASFLDNIMINKHNNTTMYSTLANEFAQHMACFEGEFRMIMANHATRVRRALLDVRLLIRLAVS